MMIGRLGQPTPEQFAQLEAKNVAITAHQMAVSKISPAKLLQNALHALGVAVGDAKLSVLKVDGKIGPKTVAATNYAFATYLNAPNKMSQGYIQQHINYLQDQVTKYVEAHGGVVNLPVTKVKKNLPALTWPGAPIPSTAPAASSGFSLPFDQKYIWYGVAGFSILLLLSAVANVARQKSKAPRRRRREAEDDE